MHKETVHEREKISHVQQKAVRKVTTNLGMKYLIST